MVAKEPVTRIFEAKASVHHKYVMQWMSSSTSGTAEAQKLFESFRGDLRNNPRGVGPGVAFAQAVLKATGRPIGLIPCSHGGTGMGQWDPALKDQGDDSLYGAMMHRVQMVGGGKKIKGLLWYQGESEVGSPEAINGYEKNFLNFIDCLRRDLGQPELPVLYVQIGRWVRDDAKLGRGYEQIRELQRRISTQRKNIYFTTVIDQTLYDPIHVSGSGQQCLGRRLAELALTYVYNKPGHGKQIDLESITVSKANEAFPVIHLKFSGVSGHLQAASQPAQFELRDASPAYKEKPLVYRVDFDPKDPASLDLVLNAPLAGPVKLICGPGIAPFLNVVDDKGMPVPAFGPVDVPVPAPAGK
jgi:sialate O-acetylesterase